MKSKRESTEYLGQDVGNDRSLITPGSSRASENEEWAWMVAEDPAFYLWTGRAENSGA